MSIYIDKRPTIIADTFLFLSLIKFSPYVTPRGGLRCGIPHSPLSLNF